MAAVVWITGLPCSGKTTVARALEEYLEPTNIFPVVIDGDDIREGLCSDLGFSEADRIENNRRVAELACILAGIDITPIVATISPTDSIRRKVKKIIKSKGYEYIEVFTQCSLGTCIKRDTKGMYRRAKKKELKNFTGISDSFEVPRNPDIIVNTEEDSIDDIVDEIIVYLTNFLAI